MSRITRRRLLSGAAAIALLGPHAQAAISLGVLPVTPATPPSGLGTLTIVNDSGSTIPSGSVTQSVGWFFAQGAVPALAVTTCTLHGTTSVDVASAAGMANGQTILIDGVPSGTHIVSIAGTTLLLSQAATISGSNILAVVPGAPQFNAGSHTFSWGQHVLNSVDHSLKWCRFWIKLGSSILGNTSLSIPITSGGAHPTPSGYTTADFTGEGIVVTGAAWGSSITNARTTSTVRSYLTSNTDANIWANQIDGDGDAGQSRKLITHMITGAMGSATADGLLECEHFMHVFPGAAGKEIRWLGAITQPWYNGASVPGNQTVFSAATWTINGGSATPIVNLAAKTFTQSGTQLNIGSNAYYRGSAEGPSGTPVMVSAATTIAPPLATNKLYWAAQNGSTNNLDLSDFGTLFLNGANNLSGPGVGTQTITPVPVSVPFDRLYFPTTTGHYQHWATGQPSGSADITARCQIDQAAWIATGYFPPYGSSLGFVPSTTTTVPASAYSTAWDPFTIVDWDQNRDGGGDGPSIGLIPQQHTSHFYNQDQLGENQVRMGGLAGAHTVLNFLDNSTPNLVNLINKSYRGMPAYDGAHFITWADTPSGFANPPTKTVCFKFNSTEHGINCCTYPYMLTGERQFLDVLEEAGNGAMMQPLNNTQWRNPINPASVVGSGLFGLMVVSEFRTIGWALRNLVFAGGMTPWPVHPDGSQRNNYLRDMSAQSCKFFHDVMVPANNYYNVSPGSPTVQSYLTTTGNFIPASYESGGPDVFSVVAAMFEQPYFASTMLAAATLGQDGNAAGWLKTCVTFYDHINTAFGAWSLFGYYQVATLDNGATITVASDDQFGVRPLGWFPPAGGTGSEVTYNSAGIGGPGGQKFKLASTSNGYVPANGDKLLWDIDVTGLPATMASDARTQPYFMVNTSVITGGSYYFDLSRTSGGSALAFSGSGTISTSSNNGDPFYFATSVSPYLSSSGAACSPITAPQSGPADMRGVAGWLSKLGITGINGTTTLAATISAMDTQIANSGGIVYADGSKYFWR